jgi:hypothetical protein
MFKFLEAKLRGIMKLMACVWIVGGNLELNDEIKKHLSSLIVARA